MSQNTLLLLSQKPVQEINQPVEKLVAELMGDSMSLTVRRFLRVEIQVKEEKEYANGKRGELRLTKEGNGDAMAMRRSNNHDRFQRAGLCPIGRRFLGGVGSPGSFLPAPAKGSRSLVCLRSRARVLRCGRATIH